MQYNYTSPRLDDGEFVFSGTQTGTGLGDFVAGLPSTLNQGYGSRTFQRGNQIGIYAQDNWKVNKRINFTYGLRWEPFLPSQAQSDFPFVEEFLMSNFVNGVVSTVYPNAPAGLVFPGDQGLESGSRGSPRTTSGFFSPRRLGDRSARPG